MNPEARWELAVRGNRDLKVALETGMVETMKPWRQIWWTGLLVGTCGLVAICGSRAQTSPPPAGEPKVPDIAGGYLSFHQISTNAVQVNPELAALCRGASQAEVEAARLQHGPHANAAILVGIENSTKIESGPIAACVQCHQAARATDFVFGSWNHSAKKEEK